MAIKETSNGQNSVAITGTASGEKAIGILGVGNGDAVGVKGEGDSTGVWGIGGTWHGVVGLSKSTTGGVGVYGHHADGGTGVMGESKKWMGLYGKSESETGGAGVMGEGDPGPGIIGKSTKWIGVYGETAGIDNGPAGVWGEHKGAGTGVKAISKDGVGLEAYSASNEAIHAESATTGGVIAAINKNSNGLGFAVYGKKEGIQGHAGFFEGNVWISGELAVGIDIKLPNADCAEDFDIANDESIEPGTVMVLSAEGGVLHKSQRAYDKRVTGVISGAGNYKPGIILDKRQSERNRKPIALLGKVFCKVDASYSPIEAGDLLTTSDTPGHAMKAMDSLKAFGAVIGKALCPLKEGQGLIPILIALQ
ncbi:hypothetical protein QEG73_01040 [Chitinophagaceae bacterium 26-R-25]|nr:hypothetical protein [Chitinophagaceae bacterium 26-R-25]